MTEIIPLPIKKTDALELYKPLRNFIKNQYGETVAKEYESPLQNIQQMRNEIRNLQEGSEASKDLILK